jgi:Spy/CpxP family protein refolding chaperone
MKRILSTALAIVLFIGAAQAQATEEGRSRHGRKGGDMFKELSLTADQQAKIKSIREAEKTEMKSLKSDGKTEADKAARKELHSKYKAQIESVLTTEQKAKLKEGKKGGRGEGFGKGDRKGQRGEFGKDLNLTSDQKAKVTSINSEFKTKMQAIKSNQSLPEDQKKEQFKQLAEAHKTNLKAVLTQDQINKLQEAKKNNKGKRNRNS